MPKRDNIDPNTGKPVEKFSWKRLANSIVKEMYNRATRAAELTRLTTEQRLGLMDRIGRWAAQKVVDAVAKRVRRRKNVQA